MGQWNSFWAEDHPKMETQYPIAWRDGFETKRLRIGITAVRIHERGRHHSPITGIAGRANWFAVDLYNRPLKEYRSLVGRFKAPSDEYTTDIYWLPVGVRFQ